MAHARPILSPLLVGRDEVLALVERRVAEARAGRGSMLCLSGEAGIGKTRVRKAAARSSQLAGLRVEGGSVAPHDRLVTLASIHDLARSMSTEVFGILGSDLLAMQGGKGGDTLASRRILVREISSRLIAGMTVPTLLAFEDLQWADELSLEVIGELARAAPDLPLLVIATYRLDDLPVGSIHREWRARLLTQRMAQEVTLERLAPDETALVTTLLLGTGLPAPREVAEVVHTRTNGIPLHIEELLAAVGDEIEAGARSIREASVPATIEDAVLARALRLSGEAQAVARAGAVLGRCFAPDVIAGILDRPLADLDAPLQELVDNAILYPFEFVDRGYYDFRHQLLRDALYKRVAPGELRRLHARAAEFGAQLAGASEIHASVHYERAGLHQQAYRAALSGARAAAAVSSRYESFELFRRAIANMPPDLPPAEKGRLFAEYTHAAAAVDRIPAIEEAARAARLHYQEAGDALGAARALVNLHMVARRDVRPRRERLALLAKVEAELDAIPPSAERAELLAQLRYDQAALELEAGRFDAAEHGFEQARSLSREAGESDIDVEAALAIPQVLRGEVAAGLGTMLDVARRAREARLESAGVTAYRLAAATAIRVMDYDAAAVGLAEGLRYADEIEQSYCRSIIAATSAHVAWATGRWDEAVQTAELELVGPGSRRGIVSSRNALAFVALGRGLVDRARTLLDESLAIGRPSQEPELILPALWGQAEAAIVAGDAARALQHCDEALELALETRDLPSLVPFVVTGVRAGLSDRRPEAAQRWLDESTRALSDLADLARPAIAHAEGLVRLSAGSLVAARGSLEAAVVGWAARGRVWETAWAHLDLATCLLRSHRHVDAAKNIAEVLEIADRLGSRPLRARADELQRQARGRISDEEAWYPLTVREFEVARQIATGMTNAEIAAELVVSPKTVSAHVEHILAKLGAGRRAEIAAWVTTTRPADAGEPVQEAAPSRP